MTDIETIFNQAGYPIKRFRKGRWQLKIETGVLQIFMDIYFQSDLIWMCTSGYLHLPQPARCDDWIVAFLSRTCTGLARFNPVPDEDGALQGIEVSVCLPHRELSVYQVELSMFELIKASVCYAPELQAAAYGLSPPPKWPNGEDLSMGLRWSGS